MTIKPFTDGNKGYTQHFFAPHLDGFITHPVYRETPLTVADREFRNSVRVLIALTTTMEAANVAGHRFECDVYRSAFALRETVIAKIYDAGGKISVRVRGDSHIICEDARVASTYVSEVDAEGDVIVHQNGATAVVMNVVKQFETNRPELLEGAGPRVHEIVCLYTDNDGSCEATDTHFWDNRTGGVGRGQYVPADEYWAALEADDDDDDNGWISEADPDVDTKLAGADYPWEDCGEDDDEYDAMTAMINSGAYYPDPNPNDPDFY